MPEPSESVKGASGLYIGLNTCLTSLYVVLFPKVAPNPNDKEIADLIRVCSIFGATLSTYILFSVSTFLVDVVDLWRYKSRYKELEDELSRVPTNKANAKRREDIEQDMTDFRKKIHEIQSTSIFKKSPE